MAKIKIVERESDVMKAIIDYLTLKNIITWRQNAGTAVHSDPNRKGGKRFVRFMRWVWPISNKIKEYSFLDLAGLTNTGIYWTIEVKIPGEYPNVAQINTIDLVKNRHGIAFWCNSVDMLIEKFKNFGVFI